MTGHDVVDALAYINRHDIAREPALLLIAIANQARRGSRLSNLTLSQAARILGDLPTDIRDDKNSNPQRVRDIDVDNARRIAAVRIVRLLDDLRARGAITWPEGCRWRGPWRLTLSEAATKDSIPGYDLDTPNGPLSTRPEPMSPDG